MGELDRSRRGFLKASVAGLTVIIAPLGSRAFAALFEEKVLTPIQWDMANGRAKFRIDGIAKVTGSKVFARDVRAADMPHWPNQQSHAFILRTTQADRTYEGFDLSLLGDELKPDRIVTAEDLARDGLAFPAFYGDDMLLPPGKTPAYLGHAVAMLIYHDFARFRFAKDKLQFHDEIIRYGAKTGPLERDPWGTFRFVRVGGATAYDEDTFSSLKDTMLFPSAMRKHEPVWSEGMQAASSISRACSTLKSCATSWIIHRPTGSYSLATTPRNPSIQPRSKPTMRIAGTTHRRNRCTWSCRRKARPKSPQARREWP